MSSDLFDTVKTFFNLRSTVTAMIIKIDDQSDIDTERDLTSEEKHILQKLLCYKVLVTSLAEFHEKTENAMRVGWNNSGPVAKSPKMDKVSHQLERDVRERLTT